MTIILNDNDMSISRNVGALSLHLAKARMSKPYTKLRDAVEGGISKAGRVGRFLVDAGETAKSSFKKLMVPGTFFEDIGIVYLGPIDGHNVSLVSEALRVAQKSKGPVLIHVVTQKGRGYAPAEMQPDVFHGVSSYDPDTGRFNGKSDRPSTYTEVFSKALVEESQARDDIVAITAAMPDGTGLTAFKEAHPNRFFDVGIAEEHAVTLAGGLAIGGQLPVVAIYSTFLQRAYDQIAINVALQDLHVVFCVDRGGLVGEDGTTHHGVFDLAYLRTLPNMKIMAPADGEQLRDALHSALYGVSGPIAIRYPRGEAASPLPTIGSSARSDDPSTAPSARLLPVGKAIKVREGSDVSILAIGRMVENAFQAAQILSEQGIEAAVYNMLWVKPLDGEAVREAAKAPLIVTVEEGTVVGGFGSAVLEALAAQRFGTVPDDHSANTTLSSADKACPRVLNIGIEDKFVSHGSIQQLLEEQGLSAQKLAVRIGHALDQEDQTL
jgi:1-deoxy-D-xylulose-5-phosphate synthase